VLFLEGSALHGELSGITDPTGGRRYLSDLDIGILTRRRIPPGPSREISRRIETAFVDRSVDGPAAKIGFYCEDDLGVQDPTPGFVEAVTRPLVLWGDPRALGRFRVPRFERIPAWEGRRLLSNRALEWLGSRAEGGVASLYAAAKLIADVPAVLLLSRGAFRGGGYAARFAEAEGLPGFENRDRERVRAWNDWRIDPRWETTPLGVGMGDLDIRRVEEPLRASILTVMRYAGATEDPEVFLGSRPVGWLAWGRAWKRWLRRRPGSLDAMRPWGPIKTPRTLLFHAAICCALGDNGGAAAVLGRLLGEAVAGTEGASLGARIAETGETMSREGID
jgi:hypothetical protein